MQASAAESSGKRFLGERALRKCDHSSWPTLLLIVINRSFDIFHIATAVGPRQAERKRYGEHNSSSHSESVVHD